MLDRSHHSTISVNSTLLKHWWSKKSIGFILLASMVTACGTPVNSSDTFSSSNLPSRSEIPGQPSPSIGQVVDDFADYVGRTTTIKGIPTDRLSNDVFILRDRPIRSLPLLVVNATRQPFTLPRNSQIPIQVTGQIRPFSIAQVTQQYGLTLDAALYQQYENQPAIFADAIALAPTPRAILQDPEAYYDRDLAVVGRIESVNSANSFSLASGQLLNRDEDLLVLYPGPTQPLLNGEPVAVTGELRSFQVEQVEQEYNFNWNLSFRRQLDTEYRDKPVLIARQVYRAPPPNTSEAE